MGAVSLKVFPWGCRSLEGVWRRETPQLLVVWRWGKKAQSPQCQLSGMWTVPFH